MVRQDLLHWLHKESVERNATIIYATHIFDGLDDWPTHLTYLTRDGSTGWQGRLEDLELNRQMKEVRPCLPTCLRACLPASLSGLTLVGHSVM